MNLDSSQANGEFFGMKWNKQNRSLFFAEEVSLMENAKETTAAFCSFSTEKINSVRPKPKFIQIHQT